MKTAAAQGNTKDIERGGGLEPRIDHCFHRATSMRGVLKVSRLPKTSTSEWTLPLDIDSTFYRCTSRYIVACSVQPIYLRQQFTWTIHAAVRHNPALHGALGIPKHRSNESGARLSNDQQRSLLAHPCYCTREQEAVVYSST